MKKQITLIGLGNAGSQVAYLGERKYPDLFDNIYINSSEADLAMVKNSNESLKFKIGDKDEIEGSGKNRSKMKEYLLANINKIIKDENFQNAIVDKKYCFIISSVSGGTGSGSAPIMMDLLRQMFPDTHFILISILPQLKASLMEQGNALEFLNELYDVLGNEITYMIYDNETASNLSPTKALEQVNENIIEDLKVLSGIDNYNTQYDSIDEADMEAIITTPGRLLVARLNKGLTEKNIEDNNLDEMIIKTIKQSAHCETDRNKKVVRWGLITYFTDQVNKLYSPDFEGLIEFIGTPIERFNHNAINDNNENLNFLYLIASGLSPINDRVKKITDRIDELKEALAKDESNRYILSGDGSSYSILEERRKSNKEENIADKIVPEDIIKKFMK